MFVPSCWEKHFLAGPSLDIFFSLKQVSKKMFVSETTCLTQIKLYSPITNDAVSHESSRSLFQGG